MTSEEQQSLLLSIEDSGESIRKAQINFKKSPKIKLTKGYVQTRSTIICEYWNTLKKAHEQLARITPQPKRVVLPYFRDDIFFDYEDLYNTLQGELMDLLEELSSQARNQESSCMSCNSGQYKNNTLVHLPKIQLPIFTSSYEAWPAFKDLFTSLVHENVALSDVQKLYYLNTSVTGEAESLLRHVQITSANYNTAWESINTRYGNKRLIINNIMKRLFNQKKLSTQSASQLKSLVDTTTECLNNLENMDVPTKSWDLMLIHLLVQKLDNETHKAWEEHVTDLMQETEDLSTWKQFKKFMEAKFRTLELVTANTSTSQPKVVKERTFHVATPFSEKKCTMCDGQHTLCHCEEFTKMEPRERSEYIKDNNLCYNCLAPGHLSFRCKAGSCRICGRRHHSLLHENKTMESAALTGNVQSQPLTSHHVVEDVEVQVNSVVTSHSHITTKQGQALLATAIVEATSATGHITPLRALIDPGSEAAFISEKATQLLKLKRYPVQGSASGLASMKTRLKHAVEVNIQPRWVSNFSLPFQAYVVPKISTSKMQSSSSTQQWPHLSGLKLADPDYLQAGPIDMLLGVKQYNKIVQDGLIKGPPETPSAQNTSLGWIIFGDLPEDQEETECHSMHVNVNDILQLDEQRRPTLEKIKEVYRNTTTRNEEGRYKVHSPSNRYSPQAPESNINATATRKLVQLRRKLCEVPNYKSLRRNTKHKIVINNEVSPDCARFPYTQNSLYQF